MTDCVSILLDFLPLDSVLVGNMALISVTYNMYNIRII